MSKRTSKANDFEARVERMAKRFALDAYNVERRRNGVKPLKRFTKKWWAEHGVTWEMQARQYLAKHEPDYRTKEVNQSSTVTKVKWVAVTEKGRFVHWREQDVDSSGWGGSSETVYAFFTTSDLAKATLLPTQDFPQMPRIFGHISYRRVSVTTTTKLLKQ